MLMKNDVPLSNAELSETVIKLAGTCDAQGSLIKALADQAAAQVVAIEQLQRRVQKLEGQGWKRGN